jgi:hypothetical protein
MSHDYACGTNDTPLPATTVRRVVTVDAYRVQHDPEWDVYAKTGDDCVAVLILAGLRAVRRYRPMDRSQG